MHIGPLIAGSPRGACDGRQFSELASIGRRTPPEMVDSVECCDTTNACFLGGIQKGTVDCVEAQFCKQRGRRSSEGLDAAQMERALFCTHRGAEFGGSSS